MNNFFIEFSDNTNLLVLEFEKVNSCTADKWYSALKEQLSRNSEIKENDRLYDFSNEQWTLESIVTSLACCVDIINNYILFIPHAISLDTINQDKLNLLHFYFEQLRGTVQDPSAIYISAPLHIRETIDEYNVLIHRAEDKLNSMKACKKRPRLVLTFRDRHRFELSNDDYDNFSLDINFGDVFINYCDVGKPLWDVFKDSDEIISNQNIRPLKWYSADINAYFLNASSNNRMPDFWQWWDQNAKLFDQLGFIKYDKRLAIGRLLVAKLKPTMSDEQYILAISKFEKINRIYI